MKKLHTFRSQYCREMKEMKTSQKSGAGADHLYLPDCDATTPSLSLVMEIHLQILIQI